MENNIIKKDYLKEYLTFAPVSLALVRAIECRCLSKLEFEHPILDVGCGDGLFASVFFKENVEQGIDISANEVTLAKKTGVYKDVTVTSASDMPFENEAFATVFSNCVLEHIPQIDDVLKEVSRVLKKGGRLIFTVPSDLFSEHLFYNSLFKRIGLSKLGDFYSRKLNSVFRHYNLYNPSKWEEKLKDAGLKLVSRERYLSPKVVKIHELMLIFSVIPLLNKKLFKKWILFPKLRRLIAVPVLFTILRGFYESDAENGSSLLLVANK